MGKSRRRMISPKFAKKFANKFGLAAEETKAEEPEILEEVVAPIIEATVLKKPEPKKVVEAKKSAPKKPTARKPRKTTTRKPRKSAKRKTTKSKTT